MDLREMSEVCSKITETVHQVTDRRRKGSTPISDEEVGEGDITKRELGTGPKNLEEGRTSSFSHDLTKWNDAEDDEEEEHERDEDGSPSLKSTRRSVVVLLRSGTNKHYPQE